MMMRVDGEHRLLDQPQRAVDILEHADRVGHHDVVERALDRGQRGRIFDVAENEMQIGIARLRLRDRLGAEIDADAIGRLQGGQQISPAAAEFQYPFAGRNQKSHELAVVVVIGGVEFAPAIQFLAVGLEVVEQVAFALTGKLDRVRGD